MQDVLFDDNQVSVFFFSFLCGGDSNWWEPFVSKFNPGVSALNKKNRIQLGGMSFEGP
jgi:hypothetical protein